MPADRDYYDVLGVERGVSREEIRSAFRKLAMEHHPDRKPGDREAERSFKEAAEAYEVLGDEEKRAAYDRFGKAGLGGRVRGFASYEDIFSAFGDLFGVGGGGAQGTSLRCEMSIKFEEAARGTTQTIRLRRSKPCRACRGTGARNGTALATCPSCGGSGRVLRSAGFFQMSATCGRCHGAGRIVKEFCRECGGEGRVEESGEVEVRIPPGIEDGTRIRMAGEGEVDAPGGVPGDLYCHVRVEPHEFFRRQGDHLICDVPITYAQAALGAEVEVPTLDGTARVKVPRGTQSGDVFRLRRQGIPNIRTGRPGDMLVQAIIEVPRKLSAGQEELLRELAELDQVAVSPRRRGFLKWLKESLSSLAAAGDGDDDDDGR